MGVVTGLATVATVLESSPDPHPEFLRTVAAIGASFFLAYVIEATWIATQVVPTHNVDGERFLGAITGFALAGFCGVVILVIQSEFQIADRLYAAVSFWWSCIALVFLGTMVAIQPYMVHTWRSLTEEDPEVGDEPL